MAERLTCDTIVDRGLIERYLAGRLSEAEVEDFESHYLTCPRCQTDLRLAAAIRDTLPEVDQARAAAAATPAGVRPWWSGRRAKLGAVAAAAIAALLAGVLLVQPSRLDSPRHRDVQRETGAVPTLQAPIGEVGAVDEFRWTAVTNADLYRVTLYDAAGDVIWETDTRETAVALADTVRLERGKVYLWQVSARVGWDRWVNSELGRFTIPQP